MKAFVKPGELIKPQLEPTYPRRINDIYSLYTESIVPKEHICKDVHIYLEDGKGDYYFHED
ncbi:MAG: hypothetical protein ILA11_10970 [Butyrivibrio sp.]|nr:hypothetical protein [Butyrivibrio sp.]